MLSVDCASSLERFAFASATSSCGAQGRKEGRGKSQEGARRQRSTPFHFHGTLHYRGPHSPRRCKGAGSVGAGTARPRASVERLKKLSGTLSSAAALASLGTKTRSWRPALGGEVSGQLRRGRMRETFDGGGEETLVEETTKSCGQRMPVVGRLKGFLQKHNVVFSSQRGLRPDRLKRSGAQTAPWVVPTKKQTHLGSYGGRCGCCDGGGGSVVPGGSSGRRPCIAALAFSACACSSAGPEAAGTTAKVSSSSASGSLS